VLRTTTPWSPTAVAVAGQDVYVQDVYVLEYLHTANEDREATDRVFASTLSAQEVRFDHALPGVARSHGSAAAVQ
jgi:hypothetical protein